MFQYVYTVEIYCFFIFSSKESEHQNSGYIYLLNTQYMYNVLEKEHRLKTITFVSL